MLQLPLSLYAALEKNYKKLRCNKFTFFFKLCVCLCVSLLKYRNWIRNKLYISDQVAAKAGTVFRPMKPVFSLRFHYNFFPLLIFRLFRKKVVFMILLFDVVVFFGGFLPTIHPSIHFSPKCPFVRMLSCNYGCMLKVFIFFNLITSILQFNWNEIITQKHQQPQALAVAQWRRQTEPVVWLLVM